VPELQGVETQEMKDAVEVGKERDKYFYRAKNDVPNPAAGDPAPIVRLGREERDALVAERERLLSQGKTLRILVAMSLCGFLQGSLQASLNASCLYAEWLGIPRFDPAEHGVSRRDWELGITNAVVFFVAAVVGAPLALAVNYLGGRRYAM
jgi:hypothetical protein